MTTLTYPGIDQFNLIFAQPAKKSFHSEACRQERIGEVAKDEEKAIYAALLTNERTAFDVCDELLLKVETEDLIPLMRAFLRKDFNAMATGFGGGLDAAVKRVAELRAIKHVEEHGAN